MTAQAALDLRRLVMRRAAWVALAILRLVIGFCGMQARGDIEAQQHAAMSFAATAAHLASATGKTDAALIAALQGRHDDTALRHLHVQLVDAARTLR